jgi:hypothetical protein
MMRLEAGLGDGWGVMMEYIMHLAMRIVLGLSKGRVAQCLSVAELMRDVKG